MPTSVDAAVIVVVDGDQRAISVGASGATVGRAPGTDIRLQDARVSRHHADIELLGSEQVLIRDRGSTNGTVVNGHRIHDDEIEVRLPVTVQVGPYELTVSSDDTSDKTTRFDRSDDESSRITVDAGRHVIVVDSGITIENLSTHEFRFLQVLAESFPRVATRDAIADRIWGPDQWDTYMLNNLVRRVRRRLNERASDANDLIVTVPRSGYRLR